MAEKGKLNPRWRNTGISSSDALFCPMTKAAGPE
jgi:hypothetical protein